MTRQKGMASNRHFSLMKSMHNFAQFRSIVDDIGQVIAGRIVKASLNGEDPKESSFDSANLNRSGAVLGMASHAHSPIAKSMHNFAQPGLDFRRWCQKSKSKTKPRTSKSCVDIGEPASQMVSTSQFLTQKKTNLGAQFWVKIYLTIPRIRDRI